MQYKCISKNEWDKTIEQLLLSYTFFASVEDEFSIDYELIKPADIPKISYNKPKPATSLKSFFLPVKENVTSERVDEKPRIIMGIPNCDIEGLGILDEIYLDLEFNDSFYRKHRENTILITFDCFDIQEHCHCTSYNIKPYSDDHADLAIINLNGTIVIRIISVKGNDFIKQFHTLLSPVDNNMISLIEKAHIATETSLAKSNTGLPDNKKTAALVLKAADDTWKKYSLRCVSCGACTAICPTCSCFLLIDKPGFEKVKQMDACQYPGFARVAGGEDSLLELQNRFRNRYLCKYVWKPEKFVSPACTGCGRCVEACIGKISKNEIFRELAK